MSEPDWADEIAEAVLGRIKYNYHPVKVQTIADAIRSAVETRDKEIAKLNKELEDLLDPRMESMRLENGRLDMSIVSPMMQRFATAIGGWFVAGGATNYVEMRLHDKVETNAVYVVTVQKSGMKTPHDCRVEAERKVETRDKRIKELEEALRPFADKSCAYAGSPDHHDGKCNIGDLRRARAALEKKQ